MSFTEQLLRGEFDRLHEDIREELPNVDVAVRSIQLLLPDTYALENIQRFLYCAPDDRDCYAKITDRFVFDREDPLPGSKPIRSLYFLPFRPPFKYEVYGTARSSCVAKALTFDRNELNQSKNPVVQVKEDIEKELADTGRLDEFWQCWINQLKGESFGDSTLWTYVLVREDSGLPAISSAFVVFDGVFGYGCCSNNTDFERLSVISKRLQDTLIRLVGKLYLKALERQASRAAISQVMARNMSHNIGSHVLSKFKDERDLNGLWGMDLRTLFERSKTVVEQSEQNTIMANIAKTYAARTQSIKNEKKTIEQSVNGESNTELPDSPAQKVIGNDVPAAVSADKGISERIGIELEQYTSDHRGNLYNPLNGSKGAFSENLKRFEYYELLPSAQLAYFNEYLKNRMDYLADIATADPVMENAMFLYADVFKGLDSNRILLNRISGISSEKFKYSVNVYLGDVKTPLNKSNDIPVSMTNDILGAQAFYIIVENIIRNIAKHSKLDEEDVKKKVGDEETIEISIVVTDYKPDSSYYEVCIFDNLWRPEKKIAEIVCSRNKAFNDSILSKPDKSLRQNNLGTIEMDVCAAYLQRLPITDVESNDYRLKFNHDQDLTEEEKIDPRRQGKKDYEVWNDIPGARDRDLDGPNVPEAKKPTTKYPKIMFAYAQKNPGATDEDQNKFSLGYRFYLKKPLEVLVVTDSLRSFPEIPKGEDSSHHFSIGELKTFGIGVTTIDDLLSSNEISNHQLVYFHSLLTDEAIKGLRRKEHWLPKRWVTCINEGCFKDPGDFIRQVWEKYAATDFLADQTVYFEGSHFVMAHESELVTKDCTIEDYNAGRKDEYNSAKRVYLDNHHYNWSECIGSESSTKLKAKRILAREPANDRATGQDNGCSVDHKLMLGAGSSSSTKIFPHQWDCYDMKCSHSRVTKFLSEIDGEPATRSNNHYNGQILSQYVENVFTKILIIDERIQENIANPKSPRLYAGVVDFYKYFKQQGIIIPRLNDDRDPNLNESSFGKLSDTGSKNAIRTELNAADKIRRFIHDHITDSRFVVIHLGVLEKMVESGAVKDSDAIENLLKNLLPTDNGGISEAIKCKIVITSGRGQPTSIPNGYAYVPLAPLQNAIETLFDKFVLTQILYNSRGIKTNG